METVVLVSNTITLPDSIAAKLHGKTLAIEETSEGILLKYTDDPIAAAKGFLCGKGFTTEKYLQHKRADKDLEGAS